MIKPNYRCPDNALDRLIGKIRIPAQVKAMLDNGCTTYLSHSGGKDSDTMLQLLPILYAHYGWRMPEILHCDLGILEWYFTPGYVQRRAAESGLSLHIIKNEQTDLLNQMHRRHKKRPDVPFAPSSVNRYCTANTKTGPTDKLVRQAIPTGEAVVAMGLRASESKKRASKPIAGRREKASSKSRTIINWNPIHAFSLEDVWLTLGLTLVELHDIQTQARAMVQFGQSNDHIAAHFGFPWHIGYLLGNTRISCAICCLASKADILNGIQHNIPAYIHLVELEVLNRHSFRADLWLGDLRQELLPPDLLEAYIKMRTEKALTLPAIPKPKSPAVPAQLPLF